MKRIVLLLLILGSINSMAQNFKPRIYNAFINGDMRIWVRILEEMEDAYKVNPNVDLLEDIVETKYGLLGYLIGNDQKNKADEILDGAIKDLEILMARNDKVARYWAYKSAFIGFNIGISPYKAPFIGAKSFRYIDEAMVLDDQNPYVLIEFANGRYYAPGFAGGDKNLALKTFKRALDILESDSNKTTESWYYLMWKTNYANLLLDEGKVDLALEIYDDILLYEPNYSWVSDELKPNALKLKSK
jgi:tetratricopeptide (TPR) repeat protein